MNGALTFTLGLETSNFLRGLGLASGGIISFAGVMQGIRAAASNIWAAINDGGKLTDLSARTGASVSSLYQLQEAFKLVGLSADAVPSMLLRVQKAMGGVDDAGNKLDDVFAELGLNLETLKQLKPEQQLETIGDALNKVGGNRATNLASRIFGREGSGDILQISRQLGDFAGSLSATAGAAQTAQATAAAFDKIGDTIQQLKTNARGLWLNIAADLAPAIQKALDMVTGAFKSGNFSELIGESLKLGFDTFLAYIPGALAQLGTWIFKAFESPLKYIQAAFTLAFQQVGEVLGNIIQNPKVVGFLNGLAAALRINGQGSMADAITGMTTVSPGYKAESFQDILRYFNNGPIFNLGSGEFGISDMQSEASRKLKEAYEKFKKQFGSAFNFASGGKQSEDSNPVAAFSSAGKGREPSALEKMGFVMGGGGSSVTSLLTSIERNTAATAKAVNQQRGRTPATYIGDPAT